MNKRWIALFLFLFIAALVVPVYGHERNDGGYFSFVDEDGNQVYATAWQVRVGDECLTDKNQRYQVTRIEGDTAFVKLIGQVDLGSTSSRRDPFSVTQILMPRIAAAAQGGKVAIYHSHSDESYVPTDGSESILGNGGIYKVGDAFATALDAKGMQAIHSMNKHDPHDNMAYERSRRTAMDLLKQQPDAIFDVHRDALPPQFYQTTIDGQDVTKVQLVVGQYGPTGKQIEDYALKVKAASDQQHPGLVKGIFFAKGGDYNQDLHPRSLLLEVGSHTNTRDEAERGIALFADVVPTVLGATSGNPGNAGGTTGFGTTGAGASGASKNIGWIVGFLILGIAVFLFVATGSFKEASSKLKQFGSTEFANFFGPKSKRKHKKHGRQDDDDSNRQ
ncbi:MAG: stage II sporulation protein P [Negativicutes bacterium]|nr:stage II sporulation protein P [Negativicutes bacterium]